MVAIEICGQSDALLPWSRGWGDNRGWDLWQTSSGQGWKVQAGTMA